jgi:hypothetical protein
VRLLSLSPLLALLLASCNGPCESLAERICSCEPNAIEEAACVEQVRAEMENLVPSGLEEETCDALLDGCTCEAIEAEQFDRCGISKGG